MIDVTVLIPTVRQKTADPVSSSSSPPDGCAFPQALDEAGKALELSQEPSAETDSQTSPEGKTSAVCPGNTTAGAKEDESQKPQVDQSAISQVALTLAAPIFVPPLVMNTPAVNTDALLTTGPTVSLNQPTALTTVSVHIAAPDASTETPVPVNPVLAQTAATAQDAPDKMESRPEAIQTQKMAQTSGIHVESGLSGVPDFKETTEVPASAVSHHAARNSKAAETEEPRSQVAEAQEIQTADKAQGVREAGAEQTSSAVRQMVIDTTGDTAELSPEAAEIIARPASARPSSVERKLSTDEPADVIRGSEATRIIAEEPKPFDDNLGDQPDQQGNQAGPDIAQSAPAQNATRTASVQDATSAFQTTIERISVSSQAPTSPVPVNPADAIRQVVSAAELTVQRGVTDLTVRLDPPELGTMHVKVSIIGGELVAQVRAETSTTHQMILSNQQDLREALQQSGLRLDRLEVPDFGASFSQYNGHHHATYQGNQGRQFRNGQQFSLGEVGLAEPVSRQAKTDDRALMDSFA